MEHVMSCWPLSGEGLSDSSAGASSGTLGATADPASDDPVWVVSTAPIGATIFTDDFESGDTTAWSTTVSAFINSPVF